MKTNEEIAKEHFMLDIEIQRAREETIKEVLEIIDKLVYNYPKIARYLKSEIQKLNKGGEK